MTANTHTTATGRDHDRLREHVAALWDGSIVDTLTTYIAIPNVSAAFDTDGTSRAVGGPMDQAVELLSSWAGQRRIAGMTMRVQHLDGRSPLIVVDIPAFGTAPNGAEPRDTGDCVVLYGHLDKQPEMTGWRDDLGPWTPVRDGDKLYGRGGADDGYATFAALGAIEALQAAGGSHARCVVLIEASEESGSPDLPAHLAALGDELGTPSLIVALDSGCLDWEHLWLTTSLRGMAHLVVRVEVLTEGVHSGEASGVVPSSFRILRQLLDRIEDSSTGEVLIEECHVEIPADRVREAEAIAARFSIEDHYPWAGGTRPMTEGTAAQLLARTWRPTVSIVGADGLPPTARGGNVLRPSTTLAISLRMPPTCDAQRALEAVKARLTADPPYGAAVTIVSAGAQGGWNATPTAPWLDGALADAAKAAFGTRWHAFGEGGSIPFMGMLGEQFPAAQFVITGVLGPHTNAHGPNEFLHLPTARRLTEAIAVVLDHHARRG